MITKEEIVKLKSLSKLDFSEKAEKSFVYKLDAVIRMISDLDEINCDGIEPLRSVCHMDQRLREDIVDADNTIDELFANFPSKDRQFAKEVQCFVVPKVIE